MSLVIALEGLDGSGKSTVWERLEDDFTNDITYTREPTHQWHGEVVRQSINDDEADSLAELFLYTADHAAHLSGTVEPAIERGESVVTDRYIGSRLAYQGVTLADEFGGIEETVEFVRKIHEPWTRYPDVTIYLDVAPETGAKRAGKTNKMEGEERLQQVQTAYQYLQEHSDRYRIVDGEQSPDAVYEDVIDILDEIEVI